MISLSRVALIALALLPAAPALSATTYRLELTQEGHGDAGPDWFGQFTLEGSTLTAISVTVQGQTYDKFSSIFPLIFLPNILPRFPDPLLYGVAFYDLSSNLTTALAFDSYSRGYPDGSIEQFNVWTLSECRFDGVCGGSSPLGGRGSYDLIEMTPVPLPATGALALAGIGGLAALRRRRS